MFSIKAAEKTLAQIADVEKLMTDVRKYYSSENVDDMIEDASKIVKAEIEQRVPKRNPAHLVNMFESKKFKYEGKTNHFIYAKEAGFYWKFVEYDTYNVRAKRKLEGRLFVENSIIATEAQVRKIFEDKLKQKTRK